MSVTQTVEIPANHRLIIDVPREIPMGKATLTFTPVSASTAESNPPRTADEALRMAAKRACDPNRKPISRHFGILSPGTYGNGVAYQRAVRDEWDN